MIGDPRLSYAMIALACALFVFAAVWGVTNSPRASSTPSAPQVTAMPDPAPVFGVVTEPPGRWVRTDLRTGGTASISVAPGERVYFEAAGAEGAVTLVSEVSYDGGYLWFPTMMEREPEWAFETVAYSSVDLAPKWAATYTILFVGSDASTDESRPIVRVRAVAGSGVASVALVSATPDWRR